jgi:Flp pilus assembly protein TadD
MKYSNALRILAGLLVMLLLQRCASTPEKATAEAERVAAAEKTSVTEKKTKYNKQNKGDEVVAAPANATAFVLPTGPATPNPYLQTKISVSAQVDNNFRAATTAMQQKNWPQAEKLLQALATTNPTLSGVQVNLGIVFRAKGDSVNAEAAFSRAITANPKNVDAYNQLAILKREAGDFAAAEMLYQKAIAVWPFHLDSHKNIAILYELYLGKPELALSHYQAYQQLLAVPDKQVDSWVADLQRRLNGAKPPKNNIPTETK